MSSFKVLIVGAGLGGLTLAQSLRRAGIDVSIFERDSTPWDRPQGYRLHLDADALNATREVLPSDLHRVFEATAQHTQPYTTILGTDLSVLRRVPTADEHDPALWPDIDRHLAMRTLTEQSSARSCSPGWATWCTTTRNLSITTPPVPA